MHQGSYARIVHKGDAQRYKRAVRKRILAIAEVALFYLIAWASGFTAIFWFTIKMMDLAYAQRGYHAYGGEMILVVLFAAAVVHTIDYIIGKLVKR